MMWFRVHRGAFVGLAALLSVACPMVADISDGLPQVTFRFERPGLPVPQYRITVARDGTAVYEGEETQTVRGSVPKDAPAAPPRPFRSEITFSHATTQKIFDMTGALKQFRVNCSSKAKNVADTGAKTLKYKGADGESECTYNYSDNKSVMQLTEMFEEIAETMNQGRELEQLHRYDRLGLDAAIAALAEEVSQGRALELNTIAPTLRSIAADTEVMERVRLKASRLLSLLPPEMQNAHQ